MSTESDPEAEVHFINMAALKRTYEADQTSLTTSRRDAHG
jgi:hypothetical protein